MQFVARCRSLVQNLFRRERADADLNDEVAAYTELLAEQKIKAGMTREEAVRAARIESGGAAQVEEEVRRVRAGAWLHTIWQDLRYSARILRKSPTFTTVAVLTFAIGIGANTAIFSMVNGLILRPVAADHPGQLTYLVQRRDHWANSFSFPMMEEIRRQSGDIFTDVIADHPLQADGLTIAGKSQTIWTAYVTTNFFSMLGVKPVLGSFIMPDSGPLAGKDAVLVLSNSYWKSRFNSDPNIVGRTALINGHPTTIIGVAPESFRGPVPLLQVQGYLPLGVYGLMEDTKKDIVKDQDFRELLVFARLRPGVDLGPSQAALEVIAHRIAQQDSKLDKTFNIRAAMLGAGLVGGDGSNPVPVISTLFLFLASMVLMLAAANVANLLLVRAIARNREMAVRSALGAARFRLLRQVLTETLLLSLLGCAGGALLGFIGSRLLSGLDLGTDFPLVLDFSFDWRVFAFAFSAAVFVALIAGVAPALRASRVDLNDVLRESGRTSTGGRQRLRTVLVVVQVSGSLMLLVVAGLFVRSLLNVQHVELGFDPNRVYNFGLNAHQAGYDEPRARAFYREVMERVRTMPGVESASLAATLPMGPIALGGPITIEGRQEASEKEKPSASMNVVTPGYLKTMRIPLLRGREIQETDTETSQHVAVITTAMAERYWPNQDPIGRVFTREDDPSHPIQIVGVMANSRTSLLEKTGPFYFVALNQDYQMAVTLQVRTTANSSTIARNVVEMLHSMEPNMPIVDVRSMGESLAGPDGYLLPQLGATLAGLLGLIGFVLAIIGVYGVMSYSAAQRTHEIGIRVALGAQPRQILNVILRRGLVIVGTGILIGLASALLLGRVIGGFLVSVPANDPLTFAVVSLLLAGVAVLACFVPARRATKVDPMVVLRYE